MMTFSTLKTFVFYHRSEIIQTETAQRFWLYNGAADSVYSCSEISPEVPVLFYDEITQENILFASRVSTIPGFVPILLTLETFLLLFSKVSVI